MPKGKNHSSKRTTLKQKYKIQKKVREHHRKERKAQKLKLKKAGGKLEYLRKKDPGIPNLWPFKEQLLKEVEDHKEKVKKEQIELALQRKKEKEKARKAKQSPEQQLAELKKNAQNSLKDFQLKQEDQISNGKKCDIENTRRAYYRELNKIVEMADVILEVLDARDPLGCRPMEVEKYIQQKDPNKRIVLVLNKIDLVPKEKVAAWLKYLRRELPAVAMKCSTQSQRSNLGRGKASLATANNDQLGGSECIGGEQLLQLLKNYSRNSNLKMSITVGVVGYPNVGKSSLINSLVRTRAVETGAQAGITKVAQEVHLDKKVKLLDCPGIVFAKDESDVAVILRNCVKLDAVVDPIPAVQEIVKRCDKLKLMTLYKLPRFGSDQEFIQLVAQARGKMKKGGVLDIEMAARSVLSDWNQGKIPYYTEPPAVPESSFSESTIVSAWGKEFDISSINEVQVIDQACVQVDEAFMALQGLSIGVTATDMAFAEAEREDDMEEEPSESAAPQKAKRDADNLPQDPYNKRVTKHSKLARAKATAAAVRKQAKTNANSDSDYDFNEAFDNQSGQYAALTNEDNDDKQEAEEMEQD